MNNFKLYFIQLLIFSFYIYWQPIGHGAKKFSKTQQ